MYVTVPGTGKTPNPIFAIVGEAPGENEELEGIPFVGQSGDLLNRILTAIKVNRNDLYITNVIKCRPTNNDIKQYIDLKKKTATPEYHAYLEHLVNELSALQTNLIVAVGQVSLFALTGIRDRIVARNGSIYFSDILRKKVLACIHPASALRQYEHYYYILFALAKATRICKYSSLNIPEVNALIFPTFSEVMSVLDQLEKSSFVCYDIETVARQVDRISFANDEICISIQLFDGTNNIFDPPQETLIWKRIAGILANKGITKVTQFGSYDRSMLHYRYGIITAGEQHDTHVAAKIVYPDLKAKLGILTSMYTDIPYYKDEGKHKEAKNVKRTTKEDYGMYSAKDSWVLKQIIRSQMPIITAAGNERFYQSKLKLIEPFIYMERVGIKADVNAIEEETKQIDKENEELTARLWSVCGTELNINSFPQMLKYFRTKKIKLRTFKGKITFDKKALQSLAAEGIEEAVLISKIRANLKLKSSYFTIGFPNERLTGAFNPSGTSSDRTSCDQSIVTNSGCNMQTLPNRLKRHLYADPGYVAYEIDESQAEYVVVANIAPEPNMLDVIRNKIDPHLKTAALIYNIPIELVSTEPYSALIPNTDFSQRDVGKRCNHALNYDMGYLTFARAANIPVYISKKLISAYHVSYPSIRGSFHKWIQKALSASMSLTSPWGRTKTFTQRWGKDLFKSAYSFIPQQTVAYIANEALNFIYYNEETFRSVVLQNLVHDSVWFQIPISIGWAEHARILVAISEFMAQPIPWKGSSFVINNDCKMRIRFDKNVTVKLDSPNLVAELERCYEKVKEFCK